MRDRPRTSWTLALLAIGLSTCGLCTAVRDRLDCEPEPAPAAPLPPSHLKGPPPFMDSTDDDCAPYQRSPRLPSLVRS